MQTNHNPPPRNAVSRPPYRGAFFQLQVVFGIAFLMATLFTAWTPGQTPTSVTNLTKATPATLAPVGQVNATHTRPLIGLVAGHWKNQNDPGAVCNDGLREVDLNLNIATLVQKYLVSQNYDVDLLAEFDSKLQLYQASALVSIHADSCDFVNTQATGFKVAAAMATQYPERANRLIACLKNRYAASTNLPLHSTSVTPDMTSYHAFGEIDPNTPAAIIETGFMNLDRNILENRPEEIALGIAQGIICFMENESIETPVPQTTP